MSLCAVNALRQITRRSFSIRSALAAGGDGSGSGHGGGSGGSIRDAGGKFGEREAASENVYFRKLEAEQLKALKKHHENEKDAIEKEMERHKESIKRHNEALKKLKELDFQNKK